VVKLVLPTADTPTRLVGTDNEIGKEYGLTTSRLFVLYRIAVWRFESFPYSKPQVVKI